MYRPDVDADGANLKLPQKERLRRGVASRIPRVMASASAPHWLHGSYSGLEAQREELAWRTAEVDAFLVGGAERSGG